MGGRGRNSIPWSRKQKHLGTNFLNVAYEENKNHLRHINEDLHKQYNAYFRLANSYWRYSHFFQFNLSFVPNFVSLFIYQWTFGLLLPFGYCVWIMLLWIWVWKYLFQMIVQLFHLMYAIHIFTSPNINNV